MVEESLTLVGEDGQSQVVVKKGARLPASGRVVFATQRAGERRLSLRLVEGAEGRLVATLTAELPPGLPANCWLPVFVTVSESGAVSVRVRENLRRIDIEPTADTTGATARTYKVG
ncbi:MAG: hypothetical protein ACAI25_01125 [Planctomycetota bacterium]